MVLQEFSEDAAVREVLNSREFANFYKQERHKITSLVRWVHDTSLPPGVGARSTTVDSGEFIIRLRTIPAPFTDAKRVAEELQHVIVEEQGYPVTGAVVPKYENFSSALNSMLHDPLVYRAIRVYRFDLGGQIERAIEESVRQLSAQANPPAHRLGRVHWMFNHVGVILECEVVWPEGSEALDQFLKWFERRYPAIAESSAKLLRLVRRMGFDSPDKMRELLQEVIRRYELSDYVVL